MKIKEIIYEQKVLYPRILQDGEAIADYIESLSKSYVDTEMMSEYYRGAKAVLRRLPIDSLTEGPSNNNIRSGSKEKKYAAMPLDTMPPIVVQGGEIEDGNHRYRVAKLKGAKDILCYDVVDSKDITETITASDADGYRIPRAHREEVGCSECGSMNDLELCGTYRHVSDPMCPKCRKRWNYKWCPACDQNHIKGYCPQLGAMAGKIGGN